MTIRKRLSNLPERQLREENKVNSVNILHLKRLHKHIHKVQIRTSASCLSLKYTPDPPPYTAPRLTTCHGAKRCLMRNRAQYIIILKHI